MFDSITKEFNDAAKEYAKLKQSVAKQLAVEYKKIGKALGDRIISFSWSQYTPHFMDGETCYFGVNEIDRLTYLDKDGEEQELEFYGDMTDEISELDEEDTELIKQAKIAAKLIKNVNDFNQGHSDLLEEAFGDHVRITIDHDGVNIDDCEHE